MSQADRAPARWNQAALLLFAIIGIAAFVTNMIGLSERTTVIGKILAFGPGFIGGYFLWRLWKLRLTEANND